MAIAPNRGHVVTALLRGMGVLFMPGTTWDRVRRDVTPPGSVVVAYALVFALFPLMGHALGGLMVERSALDVLMTAFLYPAFLLGLTAGLAAAIRALAFRLGVGGDGPEPFQIAFYSTTPMWVMGLLYAVPSHAAATALTFAALGWTGWLLLGGMAEVLDVDADRVLLPTGALYAGFAVAFVLLTQVLLILLFLRPPPA